MAAVRMPLLAIAAPSRAWSRCARSSACAGIGRTLAPQRATRPTPRRTFATSRACNAAAEQNTVALAYEHYPPAEGASISIDAQAVVLCHGLFGSKQNWRSISKSIAQKAGVPVYAVDLRNHGTSPHADSMRYDEMASDILRFFRDRNIQQVLLVGHSMGGKAVQSVALDPELPRNALAALVSVDMAPARGSLSPEFARYIEAMIEVQHSKCKTRDDAAKVLSKVEPKVGIVQFLSTNLYRAPDAEYWGWRIPLETIQRRLDAIGDFPFDDPQGLIAPAKENGKDVERPKRLWEGKTLFIKGEHSKYINRKNIPICNSFFPKMHLETLPTGHWVQAEKPREFVDMLLAFAKKDTQ